MNHGIFFLEYSNFFGHNDLDMLEVGNGNLTAEETRTHFGIWSALKSPLLIGTPVSNLFALFSLNRPLMFLLGK